MVRSGPWRTQEKRMSQLARTGKPFSHSHQRLARCVGPVVAELLEQRRLLAAGDMDTSFSGDGIATLNVGASTAEYGYSLAIQPSDGKIVVAGLTGDGSNTANDF